MIFGRKKDKTPKSSNDEPKGIIGRYYENELPVILKFVNTLPEKEIMDKLPMLTVVSWNYDGSTNNGMPLEGDNKRMIVLEDTIEEAMEESQMYLHAYSRTGNNLKEFAYYSTSQEDFMSILNQALAEHELYPIEIKFYEDEEWTDFKKLLEDFKYYDSSDQQN